MTGSLWELNLESLVTGISILAALLTFAWGFIDQHRRAQRRRTFEFLVKVIEDEGAIHQANITFGIWIAQSRVFADDIVDPEDDQVIIRLLDYYDLIADTAMQNIVDKKMIARHLGGRMRSAYLMCQSYIAYRRKRLERPGLYKPFETFITRYVGDEEV